MQKPRKVPSNAAECHFSCHKSVTGHFSIQYWPKPHFCPNPVFPPFAHPPAPLRPGSVTDLSRPGPILTAADVCMDVRADVPVPVAVMFGGSTWKHNRPGLTTRPAASGHDPASGSPGVTVTAWGGKILSARRATVPARSSPPRPRSTSGPPAVRPVSLSPSTCACPCPSPGVSPSLPSPRTHGRRHRPGLAVRSCVKYRAPWNPLSAPLHAPCWGPSSSR